MMAWIIQNCLTKCSGLAIVSNSSNSLDSEVQNSKIRSFFFLHLKSPSNKITSIGGNFWLDHLTQNGLWIIAEPCEGNYGIIPSICGEIKIDYDKNWIWLIWIIVHLAKMICIIEINTGTKSYKVHFRDHSLEFFSYPDMMFFQQQKKLIERDQKKKGLSLIRFCKILRNDTAFEFSFFDMPIYGITYYMQHIIWINRIWYTC